MIDPQEKFDNAMNKIDEAVVELFMKHYGVSRRTARRMFKKKLNKKQHEFYERLKKGKELTALNEKTAEISDKTLRFLAERGIMDDMSEGMEALHNVIQVEKEEKLKKIFNSNV